LSSWLTASLTQSAGAAVNGGAFECVFYFYAAGEERSGRW